MAHRLAIIPGDGVGTPVKTCTPQTLVRVEVYPEMARDYPEIARDMALVGPMTRGKDMGVRPAPRPWATR